MSASVLSVRNLTTSFLTEREVRPAVRDVSFDVGVRETLAIVGESGSGKSVTALSIMRLLDPADVRMDGRIMLGETDLLKLPEQRMQRIRGNDIAMIFQEPMTSLNPVLAVGEQIAEAVRLHLGYDRKKAWAHAVESLKLVEIPDAARRASDYPHHMSGGMRQRVMIALAIACRPALLIADEPTTALDVTIQAQVLALLDRLRREIGMGVLFITHNLGVVAEIADRVTVMYAGQVVESAPVRELFRTPRHPYTRALLDCMPSRAAVDGNGRRVVRSIPGQVSRVEQGCSFAPRCAHAAPRCAVETPQLETEGVRQMRCLRWRELA